MAQKQLTIDDYIAGVTAGDRALLARAITLVESSNPRHREMAQQLLQAILPAIQGASPVPPQPKAHRIGITGVPGVGKSTTIDQLGMNLVNAGHKIAVLAVDPTSTRSGGSILGDKTRMSRLAQSRQAFIRPSPTSGTLGGVAKKTRETMALCEAAGFDIIIVETVGVGQSETAVAQMVDFFCVMLLAGGGDDLQGIKKGIIEIADMIVINKADGDNVTRAELAATNYRGALQILSPGSANWTPPVITVSAMENRGLDAMWDNISAHRAALDTSGEFDEHRAAQAVKWMHDMVAARMHEALQRNSAVAARLPSLEDQVRRGQLTPVRAVDEILALLKLSP